MELVTLCEYLRLHCRVVFFFHSGAVRLSEGWAKEASLWAPTSPGHGRERSSFERRWLDRQWRWTWSTGGPFPGESVECALYGGCVGYADEGHSYCHIAHRARTQTLQSALCVGTLDEGSSSLLNSFTISFQPRSSPPSTLQLYRERMNRWLLLKLNDWYRPWICDVSC